ncbi:MAG: sugar phosphate isomerase/epimerase [Variibacter sp.]|nr:sugar phosphate isomerase/epimerase [Variibacter sp.]
MKNPFAGIALHTWTVDTTPLKEALAAAKAGGADAVEIRQLDFKRGYENGLTDGGIVDIIRQSGNTVCAMGVEYGWMFATGEESKRLFKVFRQQCENARAVGCSLMMSATGQNNGSIKDAIPHVRIAGDIAAEFGHTLCLEFNSQHPTINAVEPARELVHGAGKKNVGLLLDAYHLHRSGRIGRAFEEVPAEEIFYFQFSDVPREPSAGIPRPTDRLPPGKGVVPWQDVFQLLAEKKYTGYLSYEAPNPTQWARPAPEVVREGVEAARTLLAQAFASSVA